MKTVTGRFLVGLSFIVALVLLAACGSAEESAPAEAGITKAELQEALAAAAPAGPSAAEISALVTSAVAGAVAGIEIPEGVTSADIQRLETEACSQVGRAEVHAVHAICGSGDSLNVGHAFRGLQECREQNWFFDTKLLLEGY